MSNPSHRSKTFAAGWVYQPFEGARLVRPGSRATGRPRREYQLASLYTHEKLGLLAGAEIGPIQVAYETYGSLTPQRDNAVLICHALTGDSHVASHPVHGSLPGWWEHMVGPGKPVDTNRYFVICSNVLGGCRGTTGPSSIDPLTHKPYGQAFPLVTIRDMVRVQRDLLLSLGIPRVLAAIGGSMGGMQVLEWAVTYNTSIAGAIVMATPGRIRAQAIAYNEVQRQAILSDPAFRGGFYKPGHGPATGLALARMLGMITYQSEESMERKFGPNAAQKLGRALDAYTDVQRYLHYQGKKLVERFDANTYLYLLKALDLFDLSRDGLDYRAALRLVKARTLVMGVSSDILYPPHQQRELVSDLVAAGADARYVEIESPLGHDAFLIEREQTGDSVRRFLDGLR